MSNVFQRKNSLFFGNTVWVSETLYANIIKPYPQGTNGCVNICDVKIKDDRIIGNLEGNVTGDVVGDLYGNLNGNIIGDVVGNVTGNVTGNLVGNVTGVLYGSANPERVISIAQSGGMFNNFTDALAHATTLNPVSGNSVLIRCSPGTYFVNDTLIWPGYVDFTADNANVIIVITDPTKNVIEFQPGVSIVDRLMVTGAANACGFVRNTPGNATLLFCQVFGCDIGIHCENTDSFMRLVTTGSPGGLNVFASVSNNGQIDTSTVLTRNCVTGMKAEGTGKLRMIDTIMEVCGTAFDLSNCTAEISSCHAFDCGVGINVGTDGFIEGAEYNAFNCTTDLIVAADVNFCRLGNTKIDENKLVIGDETKVSLNINDAEGRDKYYGGATTFNIQQIDLFGAGAAGTKAPMLSIFQDDGNNTPIGNALQFTASSNPRVTIPHNAAMDFSGDFSIDFWVVPYSSGNSYYHWYISRRNCIDVYYYKFTGVLYFNIAGVGNMITSSNSLINGQRQHIALTYDNTTKEAVVYINGTLVANNTFTGNPTNGAFPMNIGNRWSPNVFYAVEGEMDEVNFWNKPLSQIEVNAQYNNGNGIVNTNTADLIMGYHFDEGAGTTATDYGINSLDGTHNGTINFVPGLVNATTSATTGVLAYHFNADLDNELFFNLHPDAGYKDGENIFPIIHWASKTSDLGDVMWAFEYTVAEPGSAAPVTQVITGVTSVDGTALKHISTQLPAFTVTDYRSIIMGRLCRIGSHVNDTYPGSVALLGAELKYVKNKLGSDT